MIKDGVGAYSPAGAPAVDCAYLAGAIDGEGSITITEHKRSDRPGYIRRNVRLQIYNTNKEWLEGLQAQFGGVLYTVRRPLEKWKDQFSLVWSEEAIRAPLLQALPFLRLKREQAEIALRYQSMKLPAKAGRKNGHSTENVVNMAEMFTRLRRLNKRGKHAIKNAEAG